jgi:hypothetical protein
VTYQSGSAFRLCKIRPYSTCSSRSHSICAMSYQPSPSDISSFSGPADQWTPLSSRPCLPMLSEDYSQQGPFAPQTLLRFIAHTNPSATLSPFDSFPAVHGYRIYLAPEISLWDEEGFSSCSACPYHRAVATTPPE